MRSTLEMCPDIRCASTSYTARFPTAAPWSTIQRSKKCSRATLLTMSMARARARSIACTCWKLAISSLHEGRCLRTAPPRASSPHSRRVLLRRGPESSPAFGALSVHPPPRIPRRDSMTDKLSSNTGSKNKRSRETPVAGSADALRPSPEPRRAAREKRGGGFCTAPVHFIALRGLTRQCIMPKQLFVLDGCAARAGMTNLHVLRSRENPRLFRASVKYPDLGRHPWRSADGHALRPLRASACGCCTAASRHRRMVAARQCADPPTGGALFAVGHFARRAGRY